MTGAEFLRKPRRLARARDVAIAVIASRGKGSHVTVQFGTRRTILKDRKKEIGPGLLKGICAQLGVNQDDL